MYSTLDDDDDDDDDDSLIHSTLDAEYTQARVWPHESLSVRTQLQRSPPSMRRKMDGQISARRAERSGHVRACVRMCGDFIASALSPPAGVVVVLTACRRRCVVRLANSLLVSAATRLDPSSPSPSPPPNLLCFFTYFSPRMRKKRKEKKERKKEKGIDLDYCIFLLRICFSDSTLGPQMSPSCRCVG